MTMRANTYLGLLPTLDLPVADLCQEHQSQHHVPDVGVHVVEVREEAQGMSA